MARLLATSDRPFSTVANCCQNGALYGCPKNLEGFLRDIGKISKWQQTLEFSGFSSVFFNSRFTIPSAPPKLFGSGPETWVTLLGRTDFRVVRAPESPDRSIPDHNP